MAYKIAATKASNSKFGKLFTHTLINWKKKIIMEKKKDSRYHRKFGLTYWRVVCAVCFFSSFFRLLSEMKHEPKLREKWIFSNTRFVFNTIDIQWELETILIVGIRSLNFEIEFQELDYSFSFFFCFYIFVDIFILLVLILNCLCFSIQNNINYSTFYTKIIIFVIMNSF